MTHIYNTAPTGTGRSKHQLCQCKCLSRKNNSCVTIESSARWLILSKRGVSGWSCIFQVMTLMSQIGSCMCGVTTPTVGDPGGRTRRPVPRRLLLSSVVSCWREVVWSWSNMWSVRILFGPLPEVAFGWRVNVESSSNSCPKSRF